MSINNNRGSADESVISGSKARADKKASQASRSNTNSECNVYYSSSVEGDLNNLLGAPHYSYRFAESKFISTMAVFGVPAHKLAMPEYYNDATALPESSRAPEKPDVHLIFRSTEEIRLLKCAWNICCFAWEFDVLKADTGIDEHPFLNQRRMLGLCDEVWVPCNYTRAVLQTYGVGNVHLVPAPIAVPPGSQTPRLEALSYIGHVLVAPFHHNFLLSQAQNRFACSTGACALVEFLSERVRANDDLRIYLSILNPEDFRKNLDAMLRAFYYFSRFRNDSVLIVKVLTSSTRFHLFDVLSDVIPRKMESGTALKCDSVVFFNDFLTDVQMSHLYSIADFYLCTSLCEGQNLPLLEAMAHGVVPVTTANTAMEDYVTKDNAIVIRDRPVVNDCPHLAGTIAGRPFLVRKSSVDDIFDGLRRSHQVTSTQYSSMSEQAKDAVVRSYAPAVVWSKITQRFAEARVLATTKKRLVRE